MLICGFTSFGTEMPTRWALHFGPVSGYVIFTDRGGDRIERALFGSGGHPDFFDIFGSREISRAIDGYEYGPSGFRYLQ